MAKKPPVAFRTKLGTAKRVERSRIWIEGQRLVDAGFTVGKFFVKQWLGPDAPAPLRAPQPTLVLTLLADDDVLAEAPCKVSGKGEKPIIDITGEMVRTWFGAGTHVDVFFSSKGGRIMIQPPTGNS